MKRLFQIDPREHGSGSVQIAWHPEGSFLATAGSSRVVHIFDRKGTPLESFALEGPCVGLHWAEDSDCLVAAAGGSPNVMIWDGNLRKIEKVDLSLKQEKDLTFVSWAPGGQLLAAGTAKGNLVLLNRRTTKKDAILGKHTKRIVCGAWSSDGRLALGGDDRQITVSQSDGTAIRNFDAKGDPSEIAWASNKIAGERQKTETCVSAVINKNALLLCSMNAPDDTVEVHFDAGYGAIIRHRWFGDGYIAVAFAHGQVVIISTEKDEIKKELLSQRFGQAVYDISVSTEASRVSVVCDDSIRFIDLVTWKEVSEERIEIPGAGRAAWSRDGRLLAISALTGEVIVHVARLPSAGGSFGTRVAWRSSLREVTVTDVTNSSKMTKVEVAIEPALVAVGAECVAIAMNNRAWFYGTNGRLLFEREYVSTLDALYLSQSHAAVLSKGRLIVHPLGPEDSEGSVSFPPPDREPDITCAAMTKDFLVYGTVGGSVCHFSLTSFTSVNEFRHKFGVRGVFPNAASTRVVVLDVTNETWLLNPITDEIVKVHSPTPVDSVAWDISDWGIFAVCSRDAFMTCVHAAGTADGSIVSVLKSATRRPQECIPLVISNGAVWCAAPGNIRSVPLSTHSAIISGDTRGRFDQCCELNRLKDAWDAAVLLKQPECWESLGRCALVQLDIDLAVRCYRMIGDAGTVMALERLLYIEDRSLLAGHVALLRGNPNGAQELFLQSPQPQAALDMRCDLLEWDEALRLAKQLAPHRVPSIAKQCAQQCEFRGDYARALGMYEIGLKGSPGAHTEACKAGMARMLLRNGDIGRGVALANQCDATVRRECATILESVRQWNDAAQMYEKSGAPEKAAAIFIQTKNWAAAAPLMPRITAPRLHAAFAKAKEADGAFKEAVVAYEAARDWDSVVRLLLTNLNSPDRAFDIVRTTRSAEAAQLAAQFCQRAGDFGAAIEFLLLAKRGDEAFQLAVAQDAMDRYAEKLGSEATTKDFATVAQYYEEKQNNAKAGHYYAKAGQHQRALRLLLSCGDSEIDAAIEVVGQSKSDALTRQIIDYLSGESSGVIKDGRYMFKLYMVLGRYPEAADVGVQLARADMETGKYLEARNKLRDVARQLMAQQIEVPPELTRDLVLLHSYVLVRTVTKINEHKIAARLLMRAAKSISRFPSHIVPVLTSTVIECQRSGAYKRSAFEYAQVLMKPENRKQIKDTVQKQIERVVRHPEKEEDEPEEQRPCPHCSLPLPVMQLDCPRCKNMIPCCIASGEHMTKEDWANCPSCHFPAKHSFFTSLIEQTGICPMCEAQLVAATIQRVSDPTPLLQRKSQPETA